MIKRADLKSHFRLWETSPRAGSFGVYVTRSVLQEPTTMTSALEEAGVDISTLSRSESALVRRGRAARGDEDWTRHLGRGLIQALVEGDTEKARARCPDDSRRRNRTDTKRSVPVL